MLRESLVADPSVTKTPEFRRDYRRYWRMNAARLPDIFYDRYFDLLSTCLRESSTDIALIARQISDPDGENHGLQYSFASKLAHTVDPRIPVFDSFIASFYFFVPPASDRPFADRLADLIGFQEFLKREYARVIDGRLLAPAIAYFRFRAEMPTWVPDQRVIDWLLWAWVSLLRNGAQHRGQALYK